jgi:hypothetical protein
MTTRADNATGIRNLCATAIHLSGHMPDSAATKFAIRAVLREAVNKSNPEYKGNNNRKNCLFISLDAEALPNDSLVDLVSDHAIPISLLIKEFYANKNHEIDQLVVLVSKYAVMVLITEAEDDKLAAAGLIKKMPDDWDGKDELARYKKVGIKVKPNL